MLQTGQVPVILGHHQLDRAGGEVRLPGEGRALDSVLAWCRAVEVCQARHVSLLAQPLPEVVELHHPSPCRPLLIGPHLQTVDVGLSS